MASISLAGDLFASKTSETRKMATKPEGSKVPHVQQKSSWDCGLACCLMILSYLGNTQADWKSISTAIGTDSVWSVDLAYLLKSHGVQFTYNTITIGVKEEYSTMSFYAKNINSDAVRVNKLFETAESQGINIQQRSVPMEELIKHALGGKSILLLVDSSMLRCKQCKGFRWWKRSAPNERSAYVGHYIVVIGYDPLTRDFLYRDPAKSDDECRIAEVDLEIARKRSGTDEDLIFIYS